MLGGRLRRPEEIKKKIEANLNNATF
jgi:hypothetical protein